MQIPLPKNLINLANNCDFPLYVVGGYVRDFLACLETDCHDIDLCAPVGAEEFCKKAEELGGEVKAVYKNTGTVKLALSEEEYEFACFRTDEYIRGAHNPSSTFFTDDIALDARRRDFKCNAVYYDIKDGVLKDPLGGLADIKNKRLSTVDNPEKVFGEDGLRLMRLARFTAQTGFEPTLACLEGAKANAQLIRDISEERIFAELDGILHADKRYGNSEGQYFGLKILDEIGVLDILLPELTKGRRMTQSEQFHYYDVLEHSLRTVRYADDRIRLAALLHDVGKPYRFRQDGNFHGHEADSARIAGEILQRLKVSKKVIREVTRLCSLHMYDTRCDARESKIRKFIVRNQDIYERLVMLKQADYSACRDDMNEAPCVTKWQEIYARMKEEHVPFNLRQLNVKGDELIAAGIKKQEVGTVLASLMEDCALDGSLNKKKKLLKRAVKVYSKGNN
ncbi:MAG: HD domain-containing protein [Clostridia bacterium]|nr:HD domain-containing protein [Clostridia bacterium]